MPHPLKEVLFKVAQREQVKTVFVAAFAQNIPYSDFLISVAAGTAFNGADDWIAAHIEAGDLVVTADNRSDCGKLAEWLMAAVSVIPSGISGSNPILSAIFLPKKSRTKPQGFSVWGDSQ